jgi:hypothetical protein
MSHKPLSFGRITPLSRIHFHKLYTPFMNHRIGTLIVAVALLAGIASCRPTRHFTIEQTAAEVIELPLEVRAADAIVTVTLNGRQVPLQLDLGGFSTISLGTKVIETLEPRLTGRSDDFRDAFGNRMSAREYVIDSVMLGAQKLGGVYGNEFLTMQRSTPPCDNGYLGHGLLRHFNLLIDYPAGKLFLLKGSALPPGYDLKDWMFDTFTGPEVVTTQVTAGRPRTFLWDTGAGFSILKPDELVDVVPGLTRRGHDAYIAKPFLFGASRIDTLAFVILDLPYPETDGLIGHNYFQQHPVYINWQTQMIATR